MASSSLDEINQYMINDKPTSKNLFLIVKFKDQSPKQEMLTIESVNSLKANINFRSCGESFCLINFSKIPAFYEESLVQKVAISSEVESVKLFRIEGNSVFW